MTCGSRLVWPAQLSGQTLSYPLRVIAHVDGSEAELGAALVGPDTGHSESVCVATQPASLCFKLTSDYTDAPILSHGCHSDKMAEMRAGSSTQVQMSNHIRLDFHVFHLAPPSMPFPPFPPAPPHSPPPPSPSPTPPPYETWPGPLDSFKCEAMLQDPKHIFRRMWGVHGWRKMEPGTPCFSRQRDDASSNQSINDFFEQTLKGAYCSMNWYEGNPGLLGLRGRPPVFDSKAPALLGADSDIGSFCEKLMRQAGCMFHPHVIAN